MVSVRNDSPGYRPGANPRGLNLALAALGFALVAGGALILHLFPPDAHPFYPRCTLHVWTGLHCPGCGSLRAMSALTHGQLQEALSSNLLLSLGLPGIAGLFVFRRLRYGNWAAAVSLPPWGWWLLLAVVIGFGLVRNLPGQPFEWLRP